MCLQKSVESIRCFDQLSVECSRVVCRRFGKEKLYSKVEENLKLPKEVVRRNSKIDEAQFSTHRRKNFE
jgi:hypothetical protein